MIVLIPLFLRYPPIVVWSVDGYFPEAEFLPTPAITALHETDFSSSSFSPMERRAWSVVVEVVGLLVTQPGLVVNSQPSSVATRPLHTCAPRKGKTWNAWGGGSSESRQVTEHKMRPVLRYPGPLYLFNLS